jgi:23S rRNA (adenine2503-C2)-methyltransferase
VKYAFRAPDGAVVEAVRIPLERPGRFVVCVSSQVGCALGCSFCGTGRMGLARNLHAWEIVDQVRLVRAGLPAAARTHGVVFQGMGEPLANVDAVIRAVRVMCNPSTLAIDARNITVCTSGFLPTLPTLLQALPNVRLAISMGSALPEKRASLIPLERSCPLSLVLDLLADHARATRIAPMWAWTLLRGVNDGDDEIAALSDLAARFVTRAGIKPRLSLLRYNPIGDSDPFEPSDPSRTEAFRAALGSQGIPVVRRYSGGADIAAACGQLGARP